MVARSRKEKEMGSGYSEYKVLVILIEGFLEIGSIASMPVV